MFIDLNVAISTNTKEIRRVYNYYKRATELHLLENPRDYYRVDKWNAMGYFDIFPKWKKKILTYLSDLKHAKQKIVYVDICGRASGKSLGADISYLFSLKTNEFKRIGYSKEDVFIDGDLFNGTDFLRLLSAIRKGPPPAFITFMPMAGLHSYTPFLGSKDVINYEVITYGLLANRLKRLVEVLRPGGYIMLERPFQFDGSFVEALLGTSQNQFELSLAVKKIARKLKCRVEITSGIGGPYFLIQKSSSI